ncbi:MAG: DUF2147 domain-containing protein [Paracoccaceae bacterium]|nr:DUF2147 domain-containing protein [Paracoccaceae bacterium]MDG2257291.1 DUF2147 domain-containing protein [Paracoccaceae bacterium]
MKQFIFTAAAMLLMAGQAMADPIFGIWRTPADDNGNSGHVQVAYCGELICGTLIKSFDASGNPMESANIGKQIIWNMKSKGNGKYGGGKVWSPDRDKIYSSKLVLDGDNLKVSGCILVVCRDGGTWERVE